MKIMPRHTGKPAIIRSGQSVLHGRVTDVYQDSFNFRIDGNKSGNSLLLSEWDAEISLLPTEPGIYAVNDVSPVASRIFKLDRPGDWTELTSSNRHASVTDYLERKASHGDWNLVPLLPKGS